MSSRDRALRALVAVSLSAALATAVFGCGPGGAGRDSGVPSEPGGAGGAVIFDMAHGEVFGADDASGLGQSSVVAAITDAGFSVQVRQERLDAQALAEASGLVLAGPMVAFSAEEQDLIEEYVRKGGVVLLTVHVPYAIADLPLRFGVRILPGIVQLAEPASGADPGVFSTDNVADHPLAAGVRELTVMSSWALGVDDERADIIVASGEDTVALTSEDLGGATPTGPFGLVSVTQVGAGSVIVIGDDAVFANVAIDQADNRRLLENILQLMAEATQTT